MKKLKYCKAFTIIELLIVMVILGILVLIIPNLDMFYLNAVKKEGVLLVRTIIEQERVYKADNGKYETNPSKIQNWKPVKTILIDNKYFRPEKQDTSNIDFDDNYKIKYDNDYNKIIVEIDTGTLKHNSKLSVEIKASPKSKAADWHIKGYFVEGKDLKNKNKDVVNKIIFEEGKEENGSNSVNSGSWKEIVL